jgi:hypothetical protein
MVLFQMSEPSFSVRTFDDSPRLVTGDPHDDDAQIIDQEVLEVDSPPEPKELPAVNQEHVSAGKRPAKTNRILSGSQVFQIGGLPQPMMVLPLDAKRKALEVHLITTVVTDNVRVGDDGNKLNTTSGAFLLQSILPFKPDNYTGPVFIHAPDVTAICTVTWYAVTE